MSPFSGETDNNYSLKHSNGAWIRTGIWACLCPASPDLVARYSMEDAKIDHDIGEGDFKKSMLTAVNCGDDTDCTATTVGSILGIMNGTAGIPKDWAEYIVDKMITYCINMGTG